MPRSESPERGFAASPAGENEGVGLAHSRMADAPAARLDNALVAAALFESRTKAREAIEAGLVTVDRIVVQKPASRVPAGARLAAAAPYPWVSRGGVKLAAALDHFGFEPQGKTCLDVGASTGGFTDVLLARGAAHVYAVDVGQGQLHRRLRADRRVTDRAGTDVRDLDAGSLPAAPALIVCDVSFISLRLVLPAAFGLAAPVCDAVVLIKPQFEVGRGNTSRGIVRDAAKHRSSCEAVAGVVAGLGWIVEGLITSPIQGGDGNVEFLLGARQP